MEIIVTTSPGIEDLLDTELREVFRKEYLGANIRKDKGRVIAHLKESNKLWEKISSLSLAHRAGILVNKAFIRTNVEGLNDLKEIIIASSIVNYITPQTTFAIRAERAGANHEYTSLDIARIAGETVIKLVESKYGSPPRVELDYPEVIVHVDVIENELYVYLSLTGDMSLHRRWYRVYDHPASLKPTLARAMLVLSQARDGEVILDPMCGSGTIPIEASLFFEDSISICMDINRRHLIGAKMNAIAAGVLNKIVFIQGDARKIKEYVTVKVDRIITNPPYGIRLGNPRAVRKLYREFMSSANNILRDGGSLTIITPEYKYIDEVIESMSLQFRKIHERKVAHGGLYPKILVYEKT